MVAGRVKAQDRLLEEATSFPWPHIGRKRWYTGTILTPVSPHNTTGAGSTAQSTLCYSCPQSVGGSVLETLPLGGEGLLTSLSALSCSKRPEDAAWSRCRE